MWQDCKCFFVKRINVNCEHACVLISMISLLSLSLIGECYSEQFTTNYVGRAPAMHFDFKYIQSFMANVASSFVRVCSRKQTINKAQRSFTSGTQKCSEACFRVDSALDTFLCEFSHLLMLISRIPREPCDPDHFDQVENEQFGIEIDLWYVTLASSGHVFQLSKREIWQSIATWQDIKQCSWFNVIWINIFFQVDWLTIIRQSTLILLNSFRCCQFQCLVNTWRKPITTGLVSLLMSRNTGCTFAKCPSTSSKIAYEKD